MVGCDLTYGLETVSNASIVENFLPSYRTFKIFPLRSNSTYWLYMTCKDREGGWHLSDTITFTTGVATLLQSQPAAVQSSLGSQQGLVETLNRGMLSVRPASNVSPHTLMGESYSRSVGDFFIIYFAQIETFFVRHSLQKTLLKTGKSIMKL